MNEATRNVNLEKVELLYRKVKAFEPKYEKLNIHLDRDRLKLRYLENMLQHAERRRQYMDKDFFEKSFTGRFDEKALADVNTKMKLEALHCPENLRHMQGSCGLLVKLKLELEILRLKGDDRFGNVVYHGCRRFMKNIRCLANFQATWVDEELTFTVFDKSALDVQHETISLYRFDDVYFRNDRKWPSDKINVQSIHKIQ